VAFAFNPYHFYFPPYAFRKLRAPAGNFRAERSPLTEMKWSAWHEYTEGLRYMRSSPLILGIALLAVGWASGGGASQILSAFREMVFIAARQASDIYWAPPAFGLLIGGAFAHWTWKTNLLRVQKNGQHLLPDSCGILRDL